MNDKDYKVCIVEGEAREPVIINNIIRIFFSHDNVTIITLPAGENIYMLWKKLKDDDFDTDIIEVLKENNNDIEEQLSGLERDDFSEVYLFFDYDGHQNNLSETENNGDSVLLQMLESFDNETENGKLYISYPMVEALRDFEEGVCGRKTNCYVALDEFADYKGISASRSRYRHFKNYNFEIWRSVIEVFAMRLSCLLNQSNTITYEEYINSITPAEIYLLENEQIKSDRVFVLSAFPEFLIDYFGRKVWTVSVKRSSNERFILKC